MATPEMSRKAAQLLNMTEMGRKLEPNDRHRFAVAVDDADRIEDLPREWRRWWEQANRQLGLK